MGNEYEQKPAHEKHKKREVVRMLGVTSTVGINMVVSTIIGFAAGYFLLDRYIFGELLSFNTFPWFTILFSILGIAAGFKYLFKVANNIKLKNNGNP
jgi:F0F1-type ATP synthase assembly protein I